MFTRSKYKLKTNKVFPHDPSCWLLAGRFFSFHNVCLLEIRDLRGLQHPLQNYLFISLQQVALSKSYYMSGIKPIRCPLVLLLESKSLKSPKRLHSALYVNVSVLSKASKSSQQLSNSFPGSNKVLVSG